MDAFVEIGADYLGTVLDGIFYGFHAALFVVFLLAHRHRGTKFYHGVLNIATILLFVLCTLVVMIDIWTEYDVLVDTAPNLVTNFNLLYSSLYSWIDFIAQMILIYRCWMVWGKRYLVVVLPTLLATASLAGEFALVGILKSTDYSPSSLHKILQLGRFAFGSSLAVNALVLALIVVRIWSVSKEVAQVNPGGAKAHSAVIAMLLESGLAVFCAQIIWLVLFSVHSAGFYLVAGAVTQIYGITPIILIIRLTLGASYDTETMLNSHTTLPNTQNTQQVMTASLSNMGDPTIVRQHSGLDGKSFGSEKEVV